MSGSVRSGLIFGLASIIVVGGLSAIPTLGQICCGPLSAILLGGVAGYLGVRWSGPTAGVGQGAIAGGITGVGVLIGTVIGFVLYFALVRALPETRQMLEEALRQQGSGGSLAPEDLDMLLNLGAPIAGFCFGLIWVVFTLGAGTLGGWLGVRQRGSPPPLAMPPAG